jgi:hypothetical protein
MEEGHKVAPSPWPRKPVDEFEPVLGGFRERFWKIGDPVRDVMESGTPAVKKTAHGGFGAERFQDFDGADEGDSDALAFQDLDRGTRIPGHELELTTCLFQRGYRHGDVVQRIGKHFRVVAWMGVLNGSRRRLNPAAWYPGPPFRTRSGIDG